MDEAIAAAQPGLRRLAELELPDFFRRNPESGNVGLGVISVHPGTGKGLSRPGEAGFGRRRRAGFRSGVSVIKLSFAFVTNVAPKKLECFCP